MQARPDTPSLAHLSQGDRELFFQYGIGPSCQVPHPVIHHAFEKHASEQPNTLAIEHKAFNHSITYHELDTQANRLATRLRVRGVVPGQRVCVLGRRSATFVIAILAVMKSGGQYVPLDATTIKDDMLHFVLEDSAPIHTLVMQEYGHRVPKEHSTMSLEEVLKEDEVLNPNPTKPEDLSSPTDGAYCIYTSGTTGRPKGVDVRHNGVTNSINGPPGNEMMGPGLRVAHLLNIAFDFGAWEILGSLYHGATLCIRGDTKKEWIELFGTVHTVFATPSMLLQHEPEWYPNIKHVVVGGEACSQALADKWSRHVNLYNCYGPTEISVFNTAHRHIPGQPLSIGRPIPNTTTYILSNDPSNVDEHGVPRPVAIGEVGLMWAGGIGVSKGYLNLPEKTSERWKKDPFVVGGGGGPDGEAWMYNTGDLGRWREDGQLDHCGRADDLVKVKGFRVELEGVSASLNTHPEVRTATTILIDSLIWGFVTPSTVPVDDVKATVAKTQPYYAVPTHLVALDEFPMTRNGKVDRNALKALVETKQIAETRKTVTHVQSSMTSTVVAHTSSSSPPSLTWSQSRTQIVTTSMCEHALPAPHRIRTSWGAVF